MLPLHAYLSMETMPTQCHEFQNVTLVPRVQILICTVPRKDISATTRDLKRGINMYGLLLKFLDFVFAIILIEMVLKLELRNLIID